MFISRFNHVPTHEREGQKLLMNFISRSADLVDPELVALISEDGKEYEFTREEKDYLLERGYAFSNSAQERRTLAKIHDDEAKASAAVYVFHLDTFDDELSGLARVTTDICETTRGTDAPRPQLFVYRARRSERFQATAHLCRCLETCHAEGLKARLMTTPDGLSAFRPLIVNGFVTEVFLGTTLSEFDVSAPIPAETEDFLDQLVERGDKVTVDIRVSSKDIRHLSHLVDYFIARGWPFLESFSCRLEPADNKTCAFGYWYSADAELPTRIFEAFRNHPETEFCSLERWIGIRNIHALIWAGQLPNPSFHFCSASKGLAVFTGSGRVFPCVRLAEDAHDSLSGKAGRDTLRLRDSMLLSDCGGCRYIPACGGGCSYHALKQNGGRVCCPPITELIETSLEAHFDELLAKSVFIEQCGQESR